MSTPHRITTFSNDTVLMLAKGMATVRRLPLETPQTEQQRLPTMGEVVYYARPICGTSIPAATNITRPGHAMCCIFVLEREDDSEFSDPQRVMTPIRYANDEPYQEIVYNIYDTAAKDCNYFPIARTPTGEFILTSRPLEDCQADGTTTTSTTTTRGSTTTVGATCANNLPCKYTWDASDRKWNLVSGCGPRSTTTAGSTTTIATTTTGSTTTCICSGGTWQATSTTTVGSTTTVPCRCSPPTFCGWEGGQCAFTSCSRLAVTPAPCSTTTAGSTTTPCDCAGINATSTTKPWGYIPGTFGGDSCGSAYCAITKGPAGNYILEDYCAAQASCYCDIGELVTGTVCSVKVQWCRYHYPDDPPPPPVCNGECEWWPVFSGGWMLVRNRCATSIPCFCDTPPSASVYCSSPEFTPCGSPTSSTTSGSTTTVDCRDYCNTTTPGSTTSTTTTTGSTTTGCQSECRWKAKTDLSGWDSIYNPCPAGCPCSAPSRAPQDTCDSAVSKCGTGTSTTTTSSTTTPHCSGDYQWQSAAADCDGDGVLDTYWTEIININCQDNGCTAGNPTLKCESAWLPVLLGPTGYLFETVPCSCGNTIYGTTTTTGCPLQPTTTSTTTTTTTTTAGSTSTPVVDPPAPTTTGGSTTTTGLPTTTTTTSGSTTT